MRIVGQVVLTVCALTVAMAALAGGGIETATANGSTEADACQAALNNADNLAHSAGGHAVEITGKSCKCKEQPEQSGYLRWSCIGSVKWETRD